jgi:hypothetical protein
MDQRDNYGSIIIDKHGNYELAKDNINGYYVNLIIGKYPSGNAQREIVAKFTYKPYADLFFNALKNA